MNTMYRAAAGVVTGARHLRTARNGQDAAAVIVDGDIVVAVVCDGCSSGDASEVGARLGARLFARAIAERLRTGDSPSDPRMWSDARVELAAVLRKLAGADRGGPDVQTIHDQFLFTIVAVAMTRDDAAVWALGDGAYIVDGQLHRLGPFTDNEPPYLGYDLLDDMRPAHFDALPASVRTIAVATDGVLDLGCAYPELVAPHFVEHPDALRRQLARLARSEDTIDWSEQRIVRVPAPLQDDCAIAIVRREVAC
jgi:hypothetical protein